MKDDEYMCWRHDTIRDLDLYEIIVNSIVFATQ